MTQEVYDDYAAAGMNTLYLTGDIAYQKDDVWETSNTKKAWDYALNAGVEKFILRDARFYDSLYGSATVTTGHFPSCGYATGVGLYRNNYVGFQGGCGVGTEVQFTFVGDNMPQVTLFADSVNAIMSKGLAGTTGVVDQKGYIITNGLQAWSGSTCQRFMQFLYCHGPNRIECHLAGGDSIKATATNFTFTEGSYVQELDADTSYRYVVGSKLDGTTVVIYAELYNVTAGTVVYKAQLDTKQSKSFVEGLGDNIIAYAGVRGTMADNNGDGDILDRADYTALPTTFTYTAAPSGSVVVSRGATFSGNTVTLEPGATGRTDDYRIIGEDYRFKTEEDFVAYLKDCLSVYINYPGFYGVGMIDEPNYKLATMYGQLYRALKKAAAELGMPDMYIQCMLLPMGGSEDWYSANYETQEYVDSYQEYLDTFYTVTGAPIMGIDIYPFKGLTDSDDAKYGVDGRLCSEYYPCLKLLAETAKKFNAEFEIAVLSWDYIYIGAGGSAGDHRIVSQEEMYMQVNSALAFGAKQIAFYTYERAVDTNTSDNWTWGVDGVYGSFIDPEGNTTDVYPRGQNAIAAAQQIGDVILGYSYEASMIHMEVTSYQKEGYEGVVNLETLYKTSYGGFADDTLTHITGVDATKDIILVTEMSKGNQTLYNVQNILDNIYSDDASAAVVTITLDPSVEVVSVFQNGAWTKVSVNGTLTLSLPLGQAAYIHIA